MKRILSILALSAALITLAWGAVLVCPYHNYGKCNVFTGKTRINPDGTMAYEYNCTCGDSVWSRLRPGDNK
jgi:hypothetical protein